MVSYVTDLKDTEENFYLHDIHKVVNTLNIPDEITRKWNKGLCVMLNDNDQWRGQGKALNILNH